MVSAQQLHSIDRDACLGDISKYLDFINKAMVTYEVNTRSRVCMYLAHLLHETQHLSRMKENVNYSAKRLMEVFPKYFDKNLSVAYANNRVAIASRVYASRMGNGPEASQDGFKYIGRGGFHVTGKDMYQAVSKELSLDLITRPELLEQPEPAMMSAGYVWRLKKMNAFADAGDIKRSTKALNGGFNGLKERIDLYEKALTIILK